MNAPYSRRIKTVSGLSLHALEWGHDRPELDHTVILIHGFLDLAWGWEELVHAGFARDLHVVAFDQRGHGDSERVGPGGYYHFMDYVSDLASLVEQVGRARVSLVGHSMGGNVASYYAGTYPERLTRLALLEGVGPPVDSTDLPERARSWIRSVSEVAAKPPRSYATLEAAAERLRKNDERLTHELALRLARYGTRTLPDGSFTFKHDPLHLTRGPYPFRLDFAESFWRRITCPVLLVEASDSIFRFLPDREARAAVFQNSEQRVIEEAGHMIQRHQPAVLCRMLCEFLGVPAPA